MKRHYLGKVTELILAVTTVLAQEARMRWGKGSKWEIAAAEGGRERPEAAASSESSEPWVTAGTARC